MPWPIMPYESPNIVLVPKKSNIVEAQRHVDQSDQVIGSNIPTDSTNVLGWHYPANVPVPNSTIFPQNVLVPNTAIYGYSQNVPVPNSNFNIYSPNVVVPNSTVYSQNVVVPNSTVYSQNVVVPNSTVYSQNVVVPNSNVYSQNVVVPNSTVYSQNVVVPNSNVYSQNVVVPNSTVYPQNLLMSNPTIYSQNALMPKFRFNIPQENLNPWNLDPQLHDFRGVNGGAVLADNITGHTFIKPPLDVYGTYGASKHAYLTITNNTGRQPASILSPKMDGAQNTKASASSADSKNVGQTILKSPEKSQSEDCDKVKNSKTGGQPTGISTPEMYGTLGACKDASLINNKTGEQPISKSPPVMYGTHGASKDASLTKNKTGGQPTSIPLPEMYGTYDASKAASLTHNKTGGQPNSIPLPEMYGTHDASKAARSKHNKTGEQPTSKSPPEMYGTHGASKDASLTNNKTGGQPTSIPLLEMDGTQNAKASASLADNKTGRQTNFKSSEKSHSEDSDKIKYNKTRGHPILKPLLKMHGTQNPKESTSLEDNKTGTQTNVKSILKSPEKSQVEHRNKVKKRVSWASNYLRSIGSDSTPLDAYWSSSRSNIMEKIESAPGNECKQIKLNLLSHENVKKGDETKTRQPLLKTPNYPLSAGVKPSRDSMTWLTHDSNKNIHRSNENTKLCNEKLTSPATLGSSCRPRKELITGLTQASDTEITLNSKEDTRTTSLLSKDITTPKSNLDIRRKPASSHTNLTSNSTTSDNSKPPINIITNNNPNEEISTNSLKTLPHDDGKHFSSINAADINPQKLQHINKVLGSFNNNINSTTMIENTSNVFVEVKHAVKALEFQEPVKPIKNQVKVSNKTINKIKMRVCHNEDTTPAMSKINKTKVEKLNKPINKKTVERDTIRLQKELKNVNEQIKELTSKQNTKTSKQTSGKEKYKKPETDKVNFDIKSKNAPKIKDVESNSKKNKDKRSTSGKGENNERFILKRNCLELTQRKRRYDCDNENKNNNKTKKITHSDSPKLQQNEQTRRNSESKTTSRPESKKVHFSDTKQENKRDHNNSKKINGNRSETNLKRSQSSENPEKKHARHDFSESIELPPRKRIRHNSEGESNNDPKIVKVGPIKSVVQQYDAFQLKHPRIQAPGGCSENDNKCDFDLRSRLSRINSKHYPKINKIFDTHPADQIEKPRENLIITLINNDAANTKLTSIPEPSKQLSTPNPIRQSLSPSSSQQSPTPDPSNQSLIPVLPQQPPTPGVTKLKINSKKYKKIQLIINVKCQNVEDSSNESSSDDNNSTDTPAINENYAVQNLDLSFLDDFNIDEIVNSLKNNSKREIKQQDIRRTVLVKNESIQKCINKFVQPIVIKNEINTEHVKIEIKDDIASNEASRSQQENAEKNYFSEIENLASSNCKELHNVGSVITQVTLTNNENETANLIKNIKEENIDDEKDNLNIDEDTLDITCEPSSNNDNIYQTMNQLIDAVTEKVSDNIEGTKKSIIDVPMPITMKSEIKTKLIIQKEKLNEIFSNDCDIEATKNRQLNVEDNSYCSEIGNQMSSSLNQLVNEKPVNALEPSTNIEYQTVNLIQNIKEQKDDKEKNLNLGELNIVDDVCQTMNQPSELVLENLRCPINKLIDDIKCKQCENNKKMNKEANMEVLSIADIEKVLEKLDSKVLPNSRDTVSVPMHIESSKMCELSESKNTSTEVPCDTNIQEENNNQIKTFNNEVNLSEDKVNDIKNVIKTFKTNKTLAPTEDEPGNNAENNKENINTLSINNNGDTRIVKIDNLTNEDRVLASAIEIRVSEYLHEELSVVSLISHGKFSKVFKFMDNNSGQNYAIKILTNESNRLPLGIEKEKMISDLQNDIPKINLNTVYFINGFGLERTWCFLMEYYPKNLRQALQDEKFSIDSVQRLARQLVTAVMILRNKNIVHSDIKPSHILLDESSQTLKVCGFDSSYYAENVRLRPNIGSLLYRPPEVILGFSAGFGIDVWAIALVIYEMLTGKKLFRGSFNNDILYEQMSLQGSLPYDMVRASRYAYNHFIGQSFTRRSGFMGMNITVINEFFKINSVWSFLLKSYHKRQPKEQSKGDRKNDLSKLASMNTLLEQMLILDPRRRIPIEFVYADPFILAFT